MKILTNHIGYEATSSKQAIGLGVKQDIVGSFRVLHDPTGREVFSGDPVRNGPVQRWKDTYFWTLDFSPVQNPGVYSIQLWQNDEIIRSFPFLIQEDLLERHTISDVLCYFKGQRCSGLLDKADRQMTFEGGPTGRMVDVHGGWYDATADYGKHLSHLCFSTYFNPQQLPMVTWSLFKSYEELRKKEHPYFRQYLRRMLDEAMFGVDYLVRVKDPDGSFYLTVSGLGPEKKPEDRRITPAMKWFGLAEPGKRNAYDPTWQVGSTSDSSSELIYDSSFRSGSGIAIAALALASRYDVCGEFKSIDYLKAAEDAFDFLEKHNKKLINDGKENIVDDYCALAAAVDLFLVTHKEVYKTAADHRASQLIARLIEHGGYRNYWRADDLHRPFFHAADAGFPVVSLLEYLQIADGETQEKVLDTIQKSLRFELAITYEVNNPFGYSRQLVQNKAGIPRTAFFFPHDSETTPWWQGENARLASMATAARLAAKHFQQDVNFFNQLQAFASNQLNWVLGLNPYDACMLHGSGRNNPEYLFFDSYEYANCPGGICNGITSGFSNEEDIDFQLPSRETGQDSDWRWSEQWLPHAAWFLLAVASR